VALRRVYVVFLIFVVCSSSDLASAETASKQPLDGSVLSTMSPQDLMPQGDRYEAEIPETLDLAERASIAVAGLTNFLDSRNNYGEFGHGFFCTNPACMVVDHGQHQNWGKIVEALILTRQMCGSEVNLDIELKSIQGMMDYAVLKMHEPYPVPLARITLALIALNKQTPRPSLGK